MSVIVSFEEEINNCEQCPFFYTVHEMGWSNTACSRITIPYYFVMRKGIDEKCPFRTNVKPAHKEGHWIEIEKDVMGLKRYKCSNCGKTDDDYSEPIFCKHCGCANGRTGKMDEVME